MATAPVATIAVAPSTAAVPTGTPQPVNTPAPIAAAVVTAAIPFTPVSTIPQSTPRAASLPTGVSVPGSIVAPPLLKPTPTTAMPATTTLNFMAMVEAARTRDLPADSSVTMLPGDGSINSGDMVSLNGTRSLYAASTIKLPLYLTLAHRIHTGEVAFTWNTPITVRPEDIVGGTGVLQQMAGQTVSVQRAAQLMIVESDNVAANILLGYLGGGHNTRRESVRAGAAVVTQYMQALSVSGITLQRGLQDADGEAMGFTNSVTTDALAVLMRLVITQQGSLDGAADVLVLLRERGTHNPWHPGEVVPCALDLSRIGGIFPATSATEGGVRLDVIAVTGHSTDPHGFVLAVGVATTPALEGEIEKRIARFEADINQLRTGVWQQCVTAGAV